MYKKIVLFSAIMSMTLILSLGCSESTPTAPVITDPDNDTLTINIVDRTGKVWDITHAVNNFGMDSNRFNFGNGPFSFRPYLNPRFVSSGEAGYPSPTDRTQILGLQYNGVVRAYPVGAFNGREVINDFAGNVPIAVTY